MVSRSNHFIKKMCTSDSKTYFVTTPIYYVNANPHIGHLYSSVIADANNRWQHLLTANIGAKSKFSTGTDEHGSKIQQAALANNTTPKTFCDKISLQYMSMAKLFCINYTDFVRTSEENHKASVQKFWRKLRENGYIYSANYKGWYCVSDETFLSQSQIKEVVKNGVTQAVSQETGHPVEWTEEHNYMFPLQKFHSDLVYWLSKREDIVKPRKFQKFLLNMLSEGSLPDISISRPSSRVHWSIQVPDDETQTVYVWLDALVNYLTAAGYLEDDIHFQRSWPPDVQVIGKDILKFHAIYWPAFLMAADLEPPRSILCHSHWTVDGEKMSKSKNNVVCPFNRSEIYTAEGMRYFLLREGVAHSDGSRLIVVHAGSATGFVPNAGLILKAGLATGDYHGEMNQENFTKWLHDSVSQHSSQFIDCPA